MCYRHPRGLGLRALALACFWRVLLKGGLACLAGLWLCLLSVLHIPKYKYCEGGDPGSLHEKKIKVKDF